MTLDEYFARPDTPGKRSPVGVLTGADGQGTRSEKGWFVGWGFLQFLFRFGTRNGVAGYVGIKTAEIGCKT
jgi:hypothetical protein